MFVCKFTRVDYQWCTVNVIGWSWIQDKRTVNNVLLSMWFDMDMEQLPTTIAPGTLISAPPKIKFINVMVIFNQNGKTLIFYY